MILCSDQVNFWNLLTQIILLFSFAQKWIQNTEHSYHSVQQFLIQLSILFCFNCNIFVRILIQIFKSFFQHITLIVQNIIIQQIFQKYIKIFICSKLIKSKSNKPCSSHIPQQQ